MRLQLDLWIQVEEKVAINAVPFLWSLIQESKFYWLQFYTQPLFTLLICCRFQQARQSFTEIIDLIWVKRTHCAACFSPMTCGVAQIKICVLLQPLKCIFAFPDTPLSKQVNLQLAHWDSAINRLCPLPTRSCHFLIDCVLIGCNDRSYRTNRARNFVCVGSQKFACVVGVELRSGTGWNTSLAFSSRIRMFEERRYIERWWRVKQALKLGASTKLAFSAIKLKDEWYSTAAYCTWTLN